MATLDELKLEMSRAVGFNKASRTQLDKCDAIANELLGGEPEPEPEPTPDPEPEPTPTDSVNPHEPEGMTAITKRHFDALDAASDGSVPWSTEFDGNPERIVSSGYQGTPPHSGPNAIRFAYRAGQTGGGEMGNLGTIEGWGPFRTVYVRTVVQWDPNWQGHDPSGVNKLGFIRKSDPAFGAGNHTVLKAFGFGDGPLSLQVTGQNYCCGDSNPAANGGSLNRGRWYDLEFLIAANTPGVKDGLLKVWKNGTQVIDRSDWNPFTSTETPTFDGFSYRPIWGGRDGTVLQDMFIWVAYTYVSGTN